MVNSEPGEIILLTENWSYTYDADGLRTSRSDGSTTYSYVYGGSQLLKMTVGSNTLYFLYDATSPTAVIYNGTTYYYATNLQGDIVAILNSSGTAVVEYTYDAWGKLLTTTGSMASTLGEHNPLRYRGYVYDTETTLYYLQSRYYDPELGRFINADGLVSTGQGVLGNNMFAYCGNNPVNFYDARGNVPENIPYGTPEWYGGWIGELFAERIEEIEKEKKEAGNVHFEPSKGGGGKIVNSFIVMDLPKIAEFSYDIATDSENLAYVHGSHEGIVIEWLVHNALCYVPFVSFERVKDTDIGYTIFDEPRPLLRGLLGGIYYIISPEQYSQDLGIYIMRKEHN